MNLWKLWETVKDQEAWHTVVYGVAKSHTRLSNWMTITNTMSVSRHRKTVLQSRQLLGNFNKKLNAFDNQEMTSVIKLKIKSVGYD